MPRTIRVKLYKFNELSEHAKQKAIEVYSGINVDFDWWDSVYEDFASICETIGLGVDQKKSYFSGFYSQGQGAGFTADVNLANLISGINGELWREYAPNLDKDNKFTPAKCNVNKRVLQLIQSGIIEFNVLFEGKDSGYPHTEADVTYDYTSGNCVNYDNINRELTNLESWIESIALELDALFISQLLSEYEYLTSDEAIIETIQANEYEFLKDGSKS